MPTRETVRKIQERIKLKADYVFFFENLKSADWVEPLRDEGFFKDPPGADKTEGGIRFVPWPESRFLARVANQAPETVVRVAREIPDSDNPRIHEDLLSIALQTPARVARALVPKLIKVVESPYSRWDHTNFARLVSHLAKGGETAPALQLARKLLEFLPDHEEQTKLAKLEAEDNWFVSLKPEPRFETYAYDEILKTAMPDLSIAAPLEAVELLCGILDAAITMGSGKPSEEKGRDGSAYWYPSLEGAPHRIDYDHKATLTFGLINTVESVLEKDAQVYPDIERILDSHKWHIFERVLMRVCHRYPLPATNRIRKFFFDINKYGDRGLDHEYFLLLRDHFGAIPSSDQRRFVQLVVEGPDIETLKAHRGEQNEAEVKRFIDQWVIERLYPIKSYLTPEESQRYHAFVASEREPREADYVRSHGGIPNVSWGPHSPKSAEDLSREDPGQVLEVLKTWKWAKGFNAPSPEGLARALQDAAKREAQKFSNQASAFKGIEPTYVRAMLTGFGEAVKEGKEIDWHGTLALCEWVTQQPVEIAGRANDKWDWNNGDPSWRNARKAIASLIQNGSSTGKGELSFDHRQRVFSILEPLTEDKDPTPDQEDTGSWKDQPVTLAINSIRGEAMHALIAHALWVHRHLREGGVAQSGFAAMPEIERVLERRLNVEIEPTRTIRSVYGQYFPHLCHIDQEWAKQRMGTIFPQHVSLKRFRNTAWYSYVTFNQPRPTVFRILQNQYAIAVASLREDKGKEHDVGNPDESLAEHLITLYWGGILDFEASGLLSSFYSTANESLRTHVIDFVGRGLHEHKGALPEDVRIRLAKFWELRLQEAKQHSGRAKCDKELLSFGWWLESEKFEPDWALKQTEEIFRWCQVLEDEFVFIKSLAKYSHHFPRACAECLLLLVTKLGPDRSFYLDREEIRTILNSALTSNDQKAIEAAQTIRNGLLARGHFEFR